MREPYGSEYESPEDPESGHSIPSAALAAHAAAARFERRRRTDREIWSLTWPVILSGMLGSAISLIDIAMLGRLGTDALAAVGYSMQFFFVSMSVFMAVGTACVAMMSRAIGAEVPERARLALAACLLLAVASAAVICAIGCAWPEPMLRALNASEHVIELAVPYLQLTLVSSVVFAASFTFESAFRAVKDTRTPLVVAGVVTVAKVVLNFLLIFGMFGFPRLDLVGAGLATVLSQCVALLLLLGLAVRRRAPEELRVRIADFPRSRGVMRETLRLSVPAAGERLAMNLAMMSYFAILGNYGPVAVAAYTVGVRLLSLSWIPGMGFSTAAATLVGQSLGAEDDAQANRAGWRATRMCLYTSTAIGLGYLLVREPLARFFVPNEPEVIAEMQPFMLMLALAQPFMAVAFTLGGALRGAGDTVTPLWSTLIGSWVFRVPIAFAAAHVLEVEVFWVWFALIFDHASRAGWLAWSFWRGRWRENVGLETRAAPA